MDKLKLRSKDILKENIEKIKELFPEVFSEGKIDFEKLKEVLGEFKESSDERYSFNWNGKAQAKRMARTSTSATLKPNKKESKDWDKTQNLYIEGDNLEVLKILQTPYYGKVKMIYIDPPYNTGKDFVYRDNFKDSIQNYLEQTGQVDDDGNKNSSNTERNGRYHTNWLNMIYPRLLLARDLLKEDGVIFISIDDHEVHNLRKVCDEVFGEGNFVGTMIHRRSKGGGMAKNFVNSHDYIHVYAKEISNIDIKQPKIVQTKTVTIDNKAYLINNDLYRRKFGGRIDKSAPHRCFFYEEIEEARGWEEKQKIDENIKRGMYFLQKHSSGNHIVARYEKLNDLYSKVFPIIEILSEKGIVDIAELKLDNFFDYPKPVSLISFLIQIQTIISRDGIILDFFSGSATTAHAVMQLNAEDGGNRKYIMVQLPEKTKEGSEAYKAGYKNICEIGKERIRRAGEKIKKELEEKNKQLKLGEEAIDVDKLDVGFKIFKLSESNLESSIIDPNKSEEEIKERLQESLDIVKHSATEEDLLYEILLKYKIELTEPIKEENVFGKKVYILGDGLLFICLDKELGVGIGDEIGKLKEKYDPEDGVRVVFRDNGFKNSEEKLNVFHTLENYGINDVKSI